MLTDLDTYKEMVKEGFDRNIMCFYSKQSGICRALIEHMDRVFHLHKDYEKNMTILVDEKANIAELKRYQQEIEMIKISIHRIPNDIYINIMDYYLHELKGSMPSDKMGNKTNNLLLAIDKSFKKWSALDYILLGAY